MLWKSDVPPSVRVVSATFARTRGVRQWAVRSRSELLADGWTSRRITAAVRGGDLVRARQDAYLDGAADDACADACRIGGRLTCVSEIARWGVFVLDASRLHVEVPVNAARLRAIARPVTLHWRPRRCGAESSVDIVRALAEAVQCQEERAAVASLDSALRLGVIGASELDEVFAALPDRFRPLRAKLDPRAESGAESLMRLLLLEIGCAFRMQVSIDGVGRVDFVVDGRLIIECDSAAHHSGWNAQRRDRRRDQAAAALGYSSLHVIAEDLFWHPERVEAAVRGLLAAR